ncbi:DUF3658 domain-containing protein [Oryzibacter oryziterrae]|uniref:DUF3658 domain-containing protein n=1 Tax=Oryzibacter oryziterrae TaxID=2766474 RepID=UPI001F192347|nr:DUF3658 domain-containing protein [Oryzibacter oryziterrae]
MTDEEIDAIILNYCVPSPRKVALVVGLSLNDIPQSTGQLIDDLYVARRVKLLVQAGRLLGYGDLDQMRYSEVALPAAS